ncbi:MAG: hypothetical protein CL885_01565 [Dehalococcoidia bacterium]|nr:hypothetical protein [Dehalococcoidia bacterium]
MTAADSGEYHVSVSNSTGTAVSKIANVIVIAAPQIIVQPNGGYAKLGGDIAISVEAKGGGDVNYQWRFDGVNIEGETNSSLLLKNLKMSDAGTYTVAVSNGAGITLSDEAEIQVLMPVSISDDPLDKSVIVGEGVFFDAAFVGSSPIEYQWYFGESPIDGANGPSLKIEKVGIENEGSYRVIASNPVSTTISEFAELIVKLPPQIVQHPVSLTAIKGESAKFTVEYAGSGPFEFQWQRNGLELEGEVASELHVNRIDRENDGNYSVVIRNPYGIAVSNVAKLQVILPVSITSQPEDKHVAVNTDLNLSVTANGTGPFEYQWFKGGEAIAGAIGSKLTVPDVTREEQGLYRVQIMNSLGTVFSRYAEIVVDEPVTIVTQPEGKSIKEGGFARFWVSATGSEPLSYQWYLDGSPIEGKTRSSMTVNLADGKNEGAYTVIVTNPVGFKVSAEAFLNVNTAPRILPIPVIVIAPGESVDVKVKAEDFDGEDFKIKYTLDNAPDGMRILRNGQLKWTANKYIDSGILNVVVIAKDEHGVEGTATVEIVVNRHPKLLKVEKQAIKVGEVFVYQPNASDPDDDELTFTIADLPEGAEFSQVDGLQWVALPNQIGDHEITVTVSDPKGFEDSQKVILTVEEAPAEPFVALYSTGDVNGEYVLDVNAQLNEELKTLTTQRVGVRRFYQLKLREGEAIRITNIKLSGENVVITYKLLDE